MGFMCVCICECHEMHGRELIFNTSHFSHTHFRWFIHHFFCLDTDKKKKEKRKEAFDMYGDYNLRDI